MRLIERGERPHRHAVYPAEIFYDLIFVLCIAKIIENLVEMESITPYGFGVLLFCVFCFSHIWLLTTAVMNRYGRDGWFDRLCQFSTMFLMYFMITSMSSEWGEYFMFNVSWIFTLFIIAVQWGSKLYSVADLTDIEKSAIKAVIALVGFQVALIAFATLISPYDSWAAQWVCLSSIVVSLVGLAFVSLKWPCNNNPVHLVHRCNELVILAMGESIISVAGMLTGSNDLKSFVLLFLVIVASFLVYFDSIKHFVQPERIKRSIAYLFHSQLVVLCMTSLAAGFYFLVETPSEEERDFCMLWAAIWVSALMIICLLSGVWGATPTRAYANWVAGTLVLVVVIVVVSVLVPSHPSVTIGLDVAIMLASCVWRRFVTKRSLGHSAA